MLQEKLSTNVNMELEQLLPTKIIQAQVQVHLNQNKNPVHQILQNHYLRNYWEKINSFLWH